MKKATQPQKSAARGAKRRSVTARKKTGTTPARAPRKITKQTTPASPRESDPVGRAFFEQAAVGMAIVDTKTGRFLDVNRRACEIARLGRGEMLATTWQAICHPDDNEQDEANMDRLRAGKIGHFSMEKRYLHADGAITWVKLAVSPAWRPGEEPLRHLAVVDDITERRRMELALRDSEARYARAVRGTNEGLWEWNIATNETYLSPRWKELLGFKDEELPNDRIVSFYHRLHPDDVARVEAARIAHLARFAPYEIEVRLRMKSGDYRWFLARGRAEGDAQGKPVMMAGTISDITARKEAEESYQRELDFIETLVNLTTAIIVLLDHKGRMAYVNDATLRMLGYTRPELVGRTPWEAGLMDATETTRAKKRLARLVAGEPNPSREAVLRGKDGRRHYVELSSTSTRTPDNVADRIIVTGADITERHQLQKEILRISEEEQARIGHNLHDGIGQTMTGISALMEGLEGEVTGSARATAARIRQLIQEAIIEVRQMSHGLSPTAVRNRGLAGALQLLAETIRISHRTGCTLKVDASIRLDDTEKETHVYRIAQEAANNALRHGRPRNITISLQGEAGGECVMTVSDDGIGITRRKGGGDTGGIGLRVMEYRASCIKGTLEVVSERQRGTTVTCRFPRVTVAEEEPALEPSDLAAAAEIGRDI